MSDAGDQRSQIGGPTSDIRHPTSDLSYAQRYEDLYLMRCFGERAQGFYVDIGAGHPVYDNVSFAFYLKGWSGITVEPNPWLAQLSRAVRPRDRQIEALVGRASGEATLHLVRDYHGLSTMIAEHAQAALREFGKRSDAITARMMTLAEVCAQGAGASFEFLKIDVEGAEKDVLAGGDWQRYRPKVVVAEALAPVTLTPAWDQWEGTLTRHGYRHVWFDGLNRYYVAEEAAELAPAFAEAPPSSATRQFRTTAPALEDATHPDHRLAPLLRSAAMIRLPVLDRALLLELLTAGLPAAELERAATEADLAAILARLFGPETASQAGLRIAELKLPPAPSVRDLYAAIADTDLFRIACGRISASYSW
jgi:FkbM family methyltransferase